MPVRSGEEEYVEIEDEHIVSSFVCFADEYGPRKKDLVQFIAVQGGHRTVNTEDITGIR